MFDGLIKEIQQAVKPEIIEVGGEKFSSKELFRVPEENLASALKVSTLQAPVDYLAAAVDGTAKDIFVHIVGFSQVRICGFLNGDRAREILLEANYEGNKFAFGNNYDQESFITQLQASFVKTDARENLQKVIGGLTDDSSVKLHDDGISQQTVAKAGITTVERLSVGNPVHLQPFRTFPEINQPESPFILRLHKRTDAVPTISLHEADNSAWKLEAIAGIKKFLEVVGVKVPIIA